MAMMKCPDCGSEYSDKADKCPKCACPNPARVSNEVVSQKGVWSTGRLVIGILSIVLFVLITFQSCAAGLSNTMQENHASSGMQGFMLAFFMLIAGIIATCTRNSHSKLGTMLPGLLYWLGALMTLGAGSTYGDLPIWGGVSFAFGLVFIIAEVKTKRK